MNDLKNEYKSFLDDIEKNIKNKEDLEYIKVRFASFLDVVLDKLEYIADYKASELKRLEEQQDKIEEKMSKMQKVINNIEKDIYTDEGYDFEIVCPYCNSEFTSDIDENKKEIECPNCRNIIELDWSGDVDDQLDNNCQGNCHGCHGCESDEDDDM
jgi:DNA-directed RNA polymerase subunit RPC12/RpoP